MAAMELKSGVTLKGGRYRIERMLGHGTFGITYLAYALLKSEGSLGIMTDEKKVAIKEFFMSDINSRSEDGTAIEGSSGSIFSNYRKKFRKEAQNISKISHPGIVKVYDIFDENGTTYYVMEYVEGSNLDRFISDNGPFSETEALEAMESIGETLSYMHGNKMLHLDIKPSNIMRSVEGKFYLIDFGLSKQFDVHGNPESSTNIGLGTPGYAPIEQASYRNEEEFPATLDIYALGATLFKMLTGKRPPEAADILSGGFPMDDLLKRKVSIKTAKAIEKAMRPNKNERFPDVKSFLVELLTKKTNKEDESTKIDPTPSSPDPSRPQKLWLIVSAVIVVVLIVGFVLLFGKLTSDSSPLSNEETVAIFNEELQANKKDIFNGFYTLPALKGQSQNDSLNLGAVPLNGEFYDREDVKNFLPTVFNMERVNVFNSKGEIIPLPNAEKGVDIIFSANGPFFEYEDNYGLRRKVALIGDSLYYYRGDCGLHNGVRQFILVSNGAKYGIADKNGDIVIPFEYNKISLTGEGYTLEKGSDVSYYNLAGEKVGKEDIIKSSSPASKDSGIRRLGNSFQDLSGKKIATFEQIWNDNSGGRYKVKQNGKWGIYSPEERKFILPAIYEDVSIYAKNTGLYPAKKDGKWGFVHSGGGKAIDFKFDAVQSFNSQTKIATVQKNGLWGYIDMEGNFIISPQYYSVSPMTVNGARVMRDKESNGFIDRDGNLIASWYKKMGKRYRLDRIAVTDSRGRVGFVDRHNENVIPFMFEDWENNLPEFNETSRMAEIYYNGIKWYIDENGAFCTPVKLFPWSQDIQAQVKARAEKMKEKY